MRSSLLPVATRIMVGLLVAACASSASPAPVTTPLATSSPPVTTPSPTASPQAVSPANTPIAAGGSHTCVLRSGDGVKCWGSNGSGQLGNGTTTQTAVPVPVDVSGLAGGVSAIAAGGDHTCALTSGGGVKCWGRNDRGQLGNRSTIQSNAPVDAMGLESGVTAIAAGGNHTCALTSGGGAKCWGRNDNGQLGDETTTDSSVPVDVAGLASGVTAIAAGDFHTCAVTSGGGAKCWGSNEYGQLGNGTATDSSLVPVDVAGLASRITAIAAGWNHTCALTISGGVTCWGSNGSGQLGNGTATDSRVPVDVSGIASGVSAIAVGGDHTCALTNGGGVKCWGYDDIGQIGDWATTDFSLVPVDVSGLASGVSAIAAGAYHTCVLTSGGGVKCWGYSVGPLGNGTPCDSSSIVPIDVDFATPSSSGEPTGTPIAVIDHATGPTDVVLQFDHNPDQGVVGEPGGEFFMPGPEFTLYGDGIVIFRNENAESPPAEGPIVRARPFTIAHLDEDQIQSLLRFALGEGGLGNACGGWYNAGYIDPRDSSGFTIRAGGLDKNVLRPGESFEVLAGHLRNFDGGGNLSTQVWVPDRYWGVLFEAGPSIESGYLPDLPGTGAVPWPWPGIAPAEFVGPADPGMGYPRRVMSADEAAVLGLSNNGGVVQRVYLLGPNRKTIYAFSLWPMFPDETSP